MRIAADLDVCVAADVCSSEVGITAAECNRGGACGQRVFQGDTRRSTNGIETVLSNICGCLAGGSPGVEIDFVVAINDAREGSDSKPIRKMEGHAAAELDAEGAFLDVVTGERAGVNIVVPANVADRSHHHWTPFDGRVAKGAGLAE